MEIKDIRGKGEMEFIIECYLKAKKNNIYLTLEDILVCIRRCDCCDDIFLVDDEFATLHETEDENGKTVHCCDECYEMLEERKADYEPDYYDIWHDRMLTEGLI